MSVLLLVWVLFLIPTIQKYATRLHLSCQWSPQSLKRIKFFYFVTKGTNFSHYLFKVCDNTSSIHPSSAFYPEWGRRDQNKTPRGTRLNVLSRSTKHSWANSHEPSSSWWRVWSWSSVELVQCSASRMEPALFLQTAFQLSAKSYFFTFIQIYATVQPQRSSPAGLDFTTRSSFCKLTHAIVSNHSLPLFANQSCKNTKMGELPVSFNFQHCEYIATNSIQAFHLWIQTNRQATHP